MKHFFIKLSQLFFLLFLIGTIINAQEAINWGTQADNLRGRNGQRFTFACPGNGTISSRLWGTDLYTDDSSICTAAVHAGLISVETGGVVTIEIRPGAGSYTAATRNGVTSQNYGDWHGSFVFVGGGGNTDAKTISWGTQADSLRGQNGQQFTYFCPADGTLSSRLWGTNLYTDDSSICTAAVHSGLINSQRGGTVVIEIRPGADSYSGSSQNGVTSKAYDKWNGSFVFVSLPVDGGNTGGASAITWGTQADGWRGKNGQRYVLQCPAGGSISSRLWGTDLYTDDSSICTAAVHAGLITTSSGGTVTIEIRPDAGSYSATTRNGVTSRSYGSWYGSFIFVH